MPSSRTPSALLTRLGFACLIVLSVAACQKREASTPEGTPANPAAESPAATTPVVPQDEAPPEGVLRAYVWECEDGQKLVMRNLFREKAVSIDFHEGTRRLDQTTSASGTRYSDGALVFWTKGETATLERPGAATVQCTERRADSLREDARARRVAYRASGNEPGWVLEIGPGKRLEWVTNFGGETHAFDDATLSAGDKPTSRVYAAGGGAMRVTVTEEACTDDAGVTSGLSAVIEFQGNTLRGCGAKLATE